MMYIYIDVVSIVLVTYYDDWVRIKSIDKNQIYYGRFRDLNPGPPAPKAGIIPLDQTDLYRFFKIMYIRYNNA